MHFLSKTRTAFLMAIAALWFVSIPNSAHSAPSGSLQTGEELLRVCKSKTARHQQACTGYIMGVIDTLLMSSIDSAHKKSICIMEKKVTYHQVRDTIIDHLKSNSENLAKDSPGLIADSLKTKYPCS